MAENSNRYDKEVGSAAAFSLLVLVIFVLSAQPYRSILDSIINSSLIEEYSYMSVLLAEVVFFIYLLVPYSKPEPRINIHRVFVFLFYTLTGSLLYLAAGASTTYTAQFSAAALVSMIIGVLYLASGPAGVRRLWPLVVALVLLIPVPRYVVEAAAVRLSRIVGGQAAILTGSELIIDGDRVIIDYGNGTFEIIYACSGIVSLTSILALLPITLYLSRNIASLSKKAATISLSLAAGAAIAYIGNLMRITLTVYAAREWGEETALKIFHGSPSIIYSALAAAVVVVVASRIASKYAKTPPRIEPRSTIQEWKSKLAGVMFLALFVLAWTGTIIEATPGSVPHTYLSTTYLEENIVDLVLKNFSRISYREVVEIRRFLGSSQVYFFSATTGEERYRGYVEYAPTPAAFHDWTICLEYQGYKVYSKWSLDIANTTIDIYLYGREDGPINQLAVALYKVYAGSPAEPQGYYVRISMFTSPGERSLDEIEVFFTQHIASEALSPAVSSSNIELKTLIAVFNVTMLVITAYYLMYALLYLTSRLVTGNSH